MNLFKSLMMLVILAFAISSQAQEIKPAVVKKGWSAMLGHVTNEGMLGYVQPIDAGPGEAWLDKTEVYGTGAFLSAGSEVYKKLCQSASFAGQQEVKVDLSQYNSSCPVQINTEGNALHAVWQSSDDTKFRVDFNLSGSQPLISEISVAKDENSPFEILAEKIHPDFQVTIGIRDSKYDVNWPWIFFDNPFSREFNTFPSVIDLKNVKVESSEGRVKITFSSITSGSFYGDLVCHIYSVVH